MSLQARSQGLLETSKVFENIFFSRSPGVVPKRNFAQISSPPLPPTPHRLLFDLSPLAQKWVRASVRDQLA